MKRYIDIPKTKTQSKGQLYLDDTARYAAIRYASGNYRILRLPGDKEYMLSLLKRLKFTKEQKALFKEIIKGG